ncbi:stomatin-like protein 1, partial [Amphibalanus amphitrite]|uniref:stomatin-like protein 1 n=1 Tax=Amphibalanus amphitrite TaxID=1232801 RepID=UPI001C91D0F0
MTVYFRAPKRTMDKVEYTAVPVDDNEVSLKQTVNYDSPFRYESAFDYRSVAKFNKASFPSKSYFTFSKQANHAQENAAADADCLTRLVSGLLLFVVFSLTVLTLPVSGWWTVRRLSQWQRLVVFRLGKVLPARGPGWALVLPGIDTTQVVDLRNRSILVPPQQVRDSSSLVPLQQLLTSDGAVAELGAEVLYRVCDAHTFVGSCVDPQASLRSLCRSVLVNTLASQELAAITRKAPETEEAVLLSINSTLKDWGMEASSVK